MPYIMVYAELVAEHMLHTPRSSIDRVASVHVIALIIPEIPLANTWPPPRNICKSTRHGTPL